ncbi:MAG: MBL fold metallo-hydrolase [Planctomycetes bacterium]|nr:MBL fold metallo-hydrolase [Planctomycetota bacterium]
MSLHVCVLASGSSGNVIYVASGSTRLLIDAGLPATETAKRLREIGTDIHEINGILLTHAHLDHCRAAGTHYHRHRIPVFAPQATFEAMDRQTGKGRGRRIPARSEVPSAIGDVSIEIFPTQHGHPDSSAGMTLGYVLRRGSASVAVATDLGAPTEAVLRALEDVQAIVLESNYEENIVEQKLGDRAFEPDWEYLQWVRGGYGHLSNRQCAEILASVMSRGRTTDVFLAHLSENHHDPRRDNNRFDLARDAVLNWLQHRGLAAPRLHRTYRRGLTQGKPSAVVEVSPCPGFLPNPLADS